MGRGGGSGRLPPWRERRQRHGVTDPTVLGLLVNEGTAGSMRGHGRQQSKTGGSESFGTFWRGVRHGQPIDEFITSRRALKINK